MKRPADIKQPPKMLDCGEKGRYVGRPRIGWMRVDTVEQKELER